MALWTVFAALAYLLAGAWLWSTIVLRDVSATDAAKCRNDEELTALCENQAMMQSGERALSAAYLICKGIFMLTWPMWLLVGFLVAMVLEGAS